MDALLKIIEPVAVVITAIQSSTATLSDVMRYWCRLGVDLSLAVAAIELQEGGPLEDALQHVGQVYVRRICAFASGIARLAFYLDPRYKAASVAPSDGSADGIASLKKLVSILPPFSLFKSIQVHKF